MVRLRARRRTGPAEPGVTNCTRRAKTVARMFAENITHFARVLRRAGVPVGPDRVIAALEAIEAVGFSHRDDVHAALSAVMLDRHEQQEIFDQAFAAFWRDPKLLEQMMACCCRRSSGRGDRAKQRRVANALADALAPTAGAAKPQDRAPTSRSTTRPASPFPTASACKAPISSR
jgi:uncharacterized protein with von Willebrand factor type A (vWA) domain